MNELTVIKCNYLGEEVFRWNARLLERGENRIVVEAIFRLENHFMGDIPLEPGDRFVETYYSDRWYNRYEVRSRVDDSLKGWYCNVAYPAEFGLGVITFRDLALDLLVYPDGRQLVLDEAEFEAFAIPADARIPALAALDELKAYFRDRLQIPDTNP